MSNNIFSSQKTIDAVDTELARLIEDAENALEDGDMEQEDFDDAVQAYETASVERYMEILESDVEDLDFSDEDEMLAA